MNTKTTKSYSKLCMAMRYWMHGKEYFKAIRAMEFAAEYHIGKRKDNITPEFEHQMSIAGYVRTLPNLIHEEETIATSFLHDVVEDYDVDPMELEKLFGNLVSNAVGVLSKKIIGYTIDPSKYFYNIGSSPITSVVKGADRMHNFQSMPGIFTKDKQLQYIKECEEFIIPMLKNARRTFPEQEAAYENIKHVLLSQIGLLRVSLDGESKPGAV